jgi:CDP-glucose 4,6-dehydratase
MSVLGVVEKIRALMGSDIEPDILDEVRHEIPAQAVSSAKAERELRWSPTVNLDAGLARTIDWYRDYLGRSSP